MEEEKCILPVKCKRCGAVFDLWYDLQGFEHYGTLNFPNKEVMERVLSESLCWNCRKVVLNSLRKETRFKDAEIMIAW